MGPTWGLSAPDGLHVGPMNLARILSDVCFILGMHVHTVYMILFYFPVRLQNARLNAETDNNTWYIITNVGILNIPMALFIMTYMT